jgi:F-type H+-transporting ATPase subunit b
MGSLGINPVLLVAQLISFSILYWVLNRFLFPVIRKALDERHEAVSRTFADRQEVEKRLAEFEKEQQRLHKQTLEETHQLLEEAKKSAAAVRQELLDKAAAERDREVAKAAERIGRAEQAARQDLAKYATDLAKEIVAKTLASESKNPKFQQDQLKKSLDTLSRVKSR